jgi:transposase
MMSKQVGASEEQSSWLVRDRAYRRYPNINKQLLTDLYCTQGLSTVEISKHLNVSRNLVMEYMDMYDIERRRPSVAGAMKSRVYPINERYFERVDEPDQAYIVGFILGDGTLVDRKKSKRLVLAIADSDREVLESIAEWLGCSDLIRRQQRPATPREQPKVWLAINNTRLVDDLVALGVPLSPKSGKESFIEFSTSELTWAFVRGVSDADGCIRVYERSNLVKGKLYGPYRRARWSVTIGMPFVYGLKEFLKREGIDLSLKCIQPKQGTALLETANQKTIREIARRMYQYGTLWLRRKKDTFDLLG